MIPSAPSNLDRFLERCYWIWLSKLTKPACEKPCLAEHRNRNQGSRDVTWLVKLSPDAQRSEQVLGGHTPVTPVDGQPAGTF
jgi:hypothetical protein